MSENDSVGESTVFSTDHRSVRGGASIISETSLTARLNNFKFSYAYQNGLTKQKCGLCHLYYHKESVLYTVPNHRIFDLQNEWSEKQKTPFKRNGRRYQSASFLYTETMVCTFCSQFFCLLADDRRERLRTAETHRRPPSNGPKLTISTPILRSDVAEHQRCYQSSTVDDKIASWAIIPPYTVHSRTRREADPWWEIEFGRTCSFHTVSFNLMIHVRQNFEIHVMLFDLPVGFDDPFLDHITTTAIAHKTFHYPAQDCKRDETVTWPIFLDSNGNLSKCKGYAIRVQLRGIHILEISHFQAQLGDELIFQTKTDSALSVNSFSSSNPIIMKEALLEMLPPEQRLRERTGTANPDNTHANTRGQRIDRNQIHFQSETAVKSLSHRIEVRYDTISEWKQRVLDHSRIFNDEEIAIIYKVIFKSTSEFNLANVNKDSSSSAFSSSNAALLDSALLEHYPRCDLQELHQRIRSVIRWIQSRSHLKMLGSLMQNEHLNSLAVNPNEALYQLNSAFKRVEHYWDKKEKYEQMYSFLERKDAKHIHVKVSEIRGCSWSQFLIILNLFCVGKCEDIPRLAYNIDNPHVATSSRVADDLVSTYSYQSGDGQSAGSFSVSLPPQIQKKLQKEQKNNKQSNSFNSSSSLLSSSDFGGGGGINDLGHQGSWISSGGRGFSSSPYSPSSSLHLPKTASASRLTVQAENSLTLSVRQQEGGKYTPFDSRFSEYKLQHLRRKLAREMVFPKQLSLEFAKQLNPRRAMIAQGNITMGDEDLNQQQLFDTSQSSFQDDAWDMTSKASNDTSLDGNMMSPSSRPTLTRGQSYKLPPVQLMVRTTSKLSALITDGSLPMDSSPKAMSLKHASHSMGKSTRSMLSENGSRTTSGGGGLASQSLMNHGSNHHDLMATVSEGGRSPSNSKANHTRINTAGSYAASSHHSPSSPAVKFKPSTASHAKATAKREDDSYDDDDNTSQNSSSTKKSHKIKAIDFHRVCALCELRLPRDSVQIKVIRKHIVTLK